MSTPFRCDDKETLISYLYDDEIDAETRRDIAAHLRSCPACASEMAAFESVRRELAAWQPPEPQLDFAIVQKPANVLRPSRWLVPASLPAWAQVAAAVLVLAAGAAIANVQVRYGSDGLVVTTGWMAPAQTPTGFGSVEPVALKPSPRTGDDWRPAFAALETDLRRELQMVRASRNEPLARAASQNADTPALLRRVQTMIEESEQRQHQELALRMTQFGRDFEVQRRADLMRINQGFGQLQGRTGVVQDNQREMMNLLRRVSASQVP